MVFVGFLCPGTPKGSTGSGSGFKSSQKTGPGLKVSSDPIQSADQDPHCFTEVCDFIVINGIASINFPC